MSEVLQDPAFSDLSDAPVGFRSTPTPGDRAFRGFSTVAALVSLVIVLLTFIFLIDQSRPAFRSAGVLTFFSTSKWAPQIGKFGVAGLAANTVIIAVVALVVGLPFSVGMALFINEYAPKPVRRVLTTAIDLLAAVPSLLFGIWGIFAFETPVVRVERWMSHHLTVLPWFRVKPGADLSQSSVLAGMVVGIMIIPIITSISRDVMSQVPREQCEGALALGGTKWGMIRDVILPFGRSGIIGGAILGFGRALGETIAILFVVEQITKVNSHILTQGSGSIASEIANLFNDASPIGRSGLVAAGLTLFLMTFVVNLIAGIIVRRAGKFK